MRIWKQVLEIKDSQVISLPRGAQIMSVQFQKGILCLWFLANEYQEKVNRRHILIVGTGHPLPDTIMRYIGTVQEPLNSEVLVWHLFEEVPPPNSILLPGDTVSMT